MIRILLLALLSCAPQAALANDIRPQAGRTYEGFTNTGTYKLMESRKGDMNGVTVRNAKIVVKRYAFQVNTLTKGLLIEGVTATSAIINKGGDFPAALQVSTGGAGSEVVIRNSEFSGFRMEPVKGKYTNGDGLDCDARSARLTVENTYAHDNSDAGFDTKCISTFDRLRAERNYRNYRFWGSIDAGTITSEDPRGAHVWIGKTATRIHIAKLVARSSEPATVLQFDAKNRGIELVIDACDFTGLAKGSVLGIGFTGNKVTLGLGCKV